MLKIESVTKYYGKKPALDGISLVVPKGVHVLLLGPNGAGKTTLIKCVMSLASFKGEITVNGINVKEEGKRAKGMIGYVPQAYALYDNISVQEHSLLTCRLKGVSKSQADEKLAQVGMLEAKKKKVRELSSGMRQRVGIALALISDPPFLILDEPTSNIDLRGRYEFQKTLDSLMRQGKTVMTTTHFAGLGELAGTVVVMDRGKIIASGEPAELLGSLGATATVFLKVEGESANIAMELIKKAGVVDISQEGGWVSARLAPSSRIDLISELMKANIKIDDMIVERVAIESEYLKFVGAPAK
jgi:ABC-type multidrug transport system ATPase subunit